MLEGFFRVSRQAEDLLANHGMLSAPAALALAHSYLIRIARYRRHVRPRHVANTVLAVPRLAVRVATTGVLATQ